MVLQNFTPVSILLLITDELLFYMDVISFIFFTILCSADFEIFSTWTAFLIVEFGFSEKYFSTSCTVSSVTTVYEGPGASHLRS